MKALLISLVVFGVSAAQDSLPAREKTGGRAAAAAERNAKLARLAGEGGAVREAILSGPLPFVPIAPCRVMDTRTGQGFSGSFGPPTPQANSTRTVPVTQSACGIPTTATAYSLNITVVPGGPLGFLTIWPSGSTRPLVSTLNALDGSVVANAAIVPAGTGGAVDVFVTDRTDVIIDINGYFGANGTARLYSVTPCRLMDTRGGFGGAFGPPVLGAGQVRDVPVPSSGCGIPSSATAYSLNVTVVPRGALGFLTIYPTGSARPNVSTLNSFTGRIVANAAIVPAGTGGAVSVFVTDAADVILDINGYLAP